MTKPTNLDAVARACMEPEWETPDRYATKMQTTEPVPLSLTGLGRESVWLSNLASHIDSLRTKERKDEPDRHFQLLSPTRQQRPRALRTTYMKRK